MFPDLYLIRHGQSEWNAAGRMQGRLDSPLTALGRAQAAALAPLLAGLVAARVASPQGRAIETARILFGDDFTTDERLCEIDVGDFSGRTRAEIEITHPGIFETSWLDWYDRCPNGEGYARLSARCAEFLAAMTGPTIAVTHGITLRMLRLHAMGLDLPAFTDLPVAQGGIHVISGGRHEVWHP